MAQHEDKNVEAAEEWTKVGGGETATQAASEQDPRLEELLDAVREELLKQGVTNAQELIDALRKVLAPAKYTGAKTTPPSAPEPAASLEEQLEQAKQELKQQEDAVKSADQNLQGATDAQKAADALRKVLEEKKNALEQLLSQSQTISTNIARRRQTAQQDLNDAETYYSELVKDLEAGLSEAYRTHIDAAIATEKTRIDAARDEVSRFKREVKGAEDEAAKAKVEATTAETDFSNARNEFEQLATRIQTVASEVARLRKAAETADQNGQGGDAFFLAYELDRGIETLRELIKPETEQGLRDVATMLLNAAVEAREKRTAATDVLNKKKTELSLAEADLQTAEKQRTANIQKKIRDFPEKEMQSHPTPATTMAGTK